MKQPMLISAQWPVHSSVRVVTSTRAGGISQPPYDSMNLGLHVGDDPADVMHNRQRLNNYLQLPAQPTWLNQTHSTIVTPVRGDNTDTNADGAYTELPNTVLAVLTADCLPLAISNLQGSCLSVVHAGWRGLAAGIIENALARFEADTELYAWLGPAIGPHAFEVGEDVRQQFVQTHAQDEQYFLATGKPGKYLADLYGLASTRLQAGGCHAIYGAEHCTYANADLFHSHRRDGVSSGRMATLMWRSSA